MREKLGQRATRRRNQVTHQQSLSLLALNTHLQFRIPVCSNRWRKAGQRARHTRTCPSRMLPSKQDGRQRGTKGRARFRFGIQVAQRPCFMCEVHDTTVQDLPWPLNTDEFYIDACSGSRVLLKHMIIETKTTTRPAANCNPSKRHGAQQRTW